MNQDTMVKVAKVFENAIKFMCNGDAEERIPSITVEDMELMFSTIEDI